MNTPKQPIEIGNWVKTKNGIKEVLGFKGSHIQSEDAEGFVYYPRNEVTLWEQQEGEWCIFTNPVNKKGEPWDDNSFKGLALAKFSHTEKYEYQKIHYTEFKIPCYTTCKPFIGTFTKIENYKELPTKKEKVFDHTKVDIKKGVIDQKGNHHSIISLTDSFLITRMGDEEYAFNLADGRQLAEFKSIRLVEPSITKVSLYPYLIFNKQTGEFLGLAQASRSFDDKNIACVNMTHPLYKSLREEFGILETTWHEDQSMDKSTIISEFNTQHTDQIQPTTSLKG